MSGVYFFCIFQLNSISLDYLFMKKIILSSLLALGSISLVNSQNLKIIKPADNHILNDSTVICYGSSALEFNQLLYVINSSSSMLTVNIKREIIDTITGTQNAICWDEICYEPSVSVAIFPENIGPGDTAKSGDEFNGDYLPNGYAGISIVHYVFFDVANYADTASITIKYNAVPTGISDITDRKINFSEPYPDPANTILNFNYSLPINVQSANLKLYNLLGDCLQTVSLSVFNNKTAMDIRSIAPGIYFCEIEADACQPVYQKLIIGK
jgi:hypothetical protein